MKAVLPLALVLAVTSAHAHRPHLQDCREFSQVAHDAAVARDNGKPLKDAQAVLWNSQTLHYGHHYKTYMALVQDVYQQEDLRMPPETVARAAKASCQKYNENELATREDD